MRFNKDSGVINKTSNAIIDHFLESDLVKQTFGKQQAFAIFLGKLFNPELKENPLILAQKGFQRI